MRFCIKDKDFLLEQMVKYSDISGNQRFYRHIFTDGHRVGSILPDREAAEETTHQKCMNFRDSKIPDL